MKKIIHAIFAIIALLGTLSGSFSVIACSENLDEILIQLNNAILNYDFAKVKVLSEKACKMDNDFGCYMYAGLLAKEYDYQNALKFLEKSCKLNHKGACAESGIYYYQGVGGTKTDTLKAIEYYKKGCDVDDKNLNLDNDYKYNVAVGCYIVGSHYTDQDNKELANKYFSKSCLLGVRSACKITIMYHMLQNLPDSTKNK